MNVFFVPGFLFFFPPGVRCFFVCDRVPMNGFFCSRVPFFFRRASDVFFFLRQGSDERLALIILHIPF